MKRSVGGKVITVIDANTELITWESCGFSKPANPISVHGFFVRNEDIKDIYIKINNGTSMLLKSSELYVVGDLSHVVSCIVETPDCQVRWGGLG